MKIGDLVKLKESAYHAGFYEEFRDVSMIVTDIETMLPGSDVEIAPVIQVMGPNGLSRFNVEDVEIVDERS